MKALEGAPSWGRFFCVLLALALNLAEAETAEETVRSTPRPSNIIVVMGDDHAQWAVGAYGLDALDTPNIDWLAERGVLFENAMSPAPVCSPARASFHTGKIPSQHGVHDFLAEQDEFDANWLSGETLLAERLSELGYRTGLFGKWHATTDSKPPQRGFDRWLSYDPRRAGWENQYRHSGTVSFSSDGDELDYTGTQAWFLTSEAIAFIDQPQDKPFFVSLNFTEPHEPFAGLPERLVARYRQLAGNLVRAGGASELEDRGPDTTTPADHVEQLAQYLAAVTLIDEQVGRLLDALQGRQLIETTLLVYTSDHGLLVGQYGLYGKTNATKPPNFYEETIRIPLVVHAPGNDFRGRQTRGEFVDLIDLHATVIDYASGGLLESAYGPGRSLRVLLEGQRNTAWRQMQFAERGNSRMVSDGRWKLVRLYHRDDDTPPEDTWYDLAHPFGERHAADPPAAPIRGRLMTGLERFFERYETAEHSGRRIWEQPAPNARMRRDLRAD